MAQKFMEIQLGKSKRCKCGEKLNRTVMTLVNAPRNTQSDQSLYKICIKGRLCTISANEPVFVCVLIVSRSLWGYRTVAR